MVDDSIKLADLKSSEKLIFDLYIDLRKRINTWAAITHQTAQARMGYVGQHLTSVVTGYPGGKSGARGYDLVLPNNDFAEIKTCYRVDQLGRCNSCSARIASIERKCPECESTDIKRNDDSKWLIGIRHDNEFAHILEPKTYYLVLFDFVDLQSPESIRSSIWEVDPKLPGFAYCMVDYRVNIQIKSTSRAPFNLWPYQLKFCLMRPTLIYRSTISTVDDSISTDIFPGRDQAQLHPLGPLDEYARSSSLTPDKISFLAELLGVAGKLPEGTKRSALEHIDRHIRKEGIDPVIVADKMATALYLRDVRSYIGSLPEPLKGRVVDLSTSKQGQAHEVDSQRQ